MKMNMKNIIKSSILGGSFLAATASSATLGEVNGTTVSVGGYVKLDAMFTDYSDGALGAGAWTRGFYVPSTTPVGGESENMAFDMHARQSRINFGTSTAIDDHTLSTFIELDFMTDGNGNEVVSNSYAPRLRHAFIKYDGWLFGQTWTTFQNLGALPETADFIGNTDFGIFVRQAQVRYTKGPWQFAIENPESYVDRAVNDDNELPDFVARYNHSSENLSISGAVLARQLTVNDPGSDIDSSTTGFGLSISGKYQIGKDDLKFGFNYGSGMGRYIGLAFASGATVDAEGDLEAIDSMAYYLGYRHFWGDKLRSTVTYSVIDVDTDVAGANEMSSSMRVNLMYSPVANLTVGGELASATRELVGGADGSMTRLQFIAKLAF